MTNLGRFVFGCLIVLLGILALAFADWLVTTISGYPQWRP